MNNLIGRQGENLVFLMSLPRSGSTLLSMMLGAHKRLSCPPEPWLLLFAAECFNLAGVRTAPYGRNTAQLAATDFLLGLEYEKTGTLENLITRGRKVTNSCSDIESIACEFVRNVYCLQLSASGKSIFIDKTPRNYTILPLINKCFPLAKKIFLKRNPLDIALSYANTWGIPIAELVGHNVTVNSRDFVEGLFTLSSYFSRPNALNHILAYEDLVTDSPSQLTDICRFLGVDYLPNMLEYYKDDLLTRQFKNSAIGDPVSSKNAKAINSNSIGRGINGLSESDLQTLLSVLGRNVFNELGYSDTLHLLSGKGIDIPDEETSQEYRNNVTLQLYSKDIVEGDREMALGLQIESLVSSFKESESDRAARGKQIETLTELLKTSESDRAARGEQIEILTELLKDSEADRAAKDELIDSMIADIAALFPKFLLRFIVRFTKFQKVKRLAKYL